MSDSTDTVFVVDDHPDNVALLAQLLRNAGYLVRVANSGKRALAAIASHPPDLVLLDINMPELSGYQVCEQLKAAPATRDIPVVFLSALDDVRDKVEAFRAGGVDYVTKPFQAEEVLARVAAQLGLAHMRRELEVKNRELEQRNRELARARRDNDGLFQAMAAALPGSTLDGRYRLEARIGSGGFAVVYRGFDLVEQRVVAVKVLHHRHGEDEALLEQFLREAKLGKLANAVDVLDSGVTVEGIAYLVMELLDGETLADELRRGALSASRAAHLLVPTCDVLIAAHARGVIHRDIKPANIFACRDGSVKVLDFGIAKLRDTAERHDSTTLGRLIGTPVYIAPERLLGKPYDERIDTYALGVTLYELLAGAPPFRADNMGALIKACVDDAPRALGELAPQLPAGLESLVHRMLHKRAGDRPPLAHVRAALAAVATDAALLDAVPTLDSVPRR